MTKSPPEHTWLPHPVAYVLERIDVTLPGLYLVWVLLLGLVVAVVTPPWQNPDEATHMLRISQIANGGLLGYRFGHEAGGMADPAILRSLLTVYSVFQHYDQKVSLGMLANAGAVPWGAPAELGFAASARYGPVLYAPAVVAVEVGRLLRLSVVHTLIATRMANTFAAGLLAAFALSLARRTRLALAVLLLLPMTVAMFTSASQDGLMIALTLAVIGCVDRIIDEDRDARLGEALLVGVGTVVLIMARPTYLPFAALPLACTRQLRLHVWATALAILMAGAIWSAYVVFSIAVPLLPTVDVAAQLSYLLYQPLSIFPIMTKTLVEFSPGYLDAFIGVLGTLDTPLPQIYYKLTVIVMVLAFASTAAGPTRRAWVPLLAGLAIVAAIFLSQYLTWTLPQTDHVEGIEGRYFLAPIAVLALAVPARRRFGEILHPLALISVIGFAMLTPMIMVHALVLRYYLVP